MLPVPIFDRIEIELIESGIELTCSQPGIPTDSSNLVWRAAERFLAKVGSETGVRIHLELLAATTNCSNNRCCAGSLAAVNSGCHWTPNNHG